MTIADQLAAPVAELHARVDELQERAPQIVGAACALRHDRDEQEARADAEQGRAERAETALEAALLRQQGLERRNERVRAEYERLLGEARREIRRLSDRVVTQIAEEHRLRTDLAAAQAHTCGHWWRRHPAEIPTPRSGGQL